MLFGKKTRSPWLAVIAAVLVLIAIGSSYAISNSRPHVEAVFPVAERVAVPAAAPVRITFDRGMNPDSLPESLITDPPRDGTYNWDGNMLSFQPESPWPQGETITITLTTEARSSLGVALSSEFTWAFQTAPTLLAYLWPADGPADLYALAPETGERLRLTTSELGVLDYSLAPDGVSILYSALNNESGADIYRLDLIDEVSALLIPCGANLCQRPQASPDGTRIAYEDATSRRILILEAGESLPVARGSLPVWSPDGRLLAYDAVDSAYFTYDPVSGQMSAYPNVAGGDPSWKPDSTGWVAPDFIAGIVGSHILAYTAFGDARDLTRGFAAGGVEDFSPVYSPDGSLVVFARRFLNLSDWTPGRQIWVMDAEGLNPIKLTDSVLNNHLGFAWHPDGTQIAYLRSNQADLYEPPEIWLINPDGSNPIRLLINGFSPQWLP